MLTFVPMDSKIRVRFAPSPTGGLHLGGVRTVLYNYLFAKKAGGDFILRIEDTDQTRFVEGAEQYIMDTLQWCRLVPDESPAVGGPFGPYRQSERKEIYRQYADQLVKEGFAYYAFDTPEELDKMRAEYKTEQNPSPQYDHHLRMKMRNSITLPGNEVETLLSNGTPYVIRIKMPVNEEIGFNDMIRGYITFNTSQFDDKVLLKADGMPTYHLAVVVDDYLMKITHAFRGEEWLPSAPVHLLLWKYLGWESNMPQWAHFPLIMGPSGKLSKRDGSKYGFPVFAMNWTDPRSGEFTEGFREKGFLPEAFINMLAMLGWNDGTEKEIFSMEELLDSFSLERVHKAGARFDYEKAKWFNHEWIKKTGNDQLAGELQSQVEKKQEEQGIIIQVPDIKKLQQIIGLVKERCHLLTDLWEQSFFFFIRPENPDISAIQGKWTPEKKIFFEELMKEISAIDTWNSAFIEEGFKQIAARNNIKPGEVQLPFRIMLVGGKFGPPVFDIADVLGKEETNTRISNVLNMLG